jgi:hypothetical protein
VQKNYRDPNVNLSDLVKKIIDFFESEKFNNVTALKTETGFQVIAGDSDRYKMENDVSVDIKGNPDDFTISLTSCKEEKTNRTPMMLAQMFGLGYFYLKSVRSQEAMLKLETNFRKKIDNMIAQAREANHQEDKNMQPPTTL